MILILKSVSLHFKGLYLAFLMQELSGDEFELTVHIIDSGLAFIQLTLLLPAPLTLLSLTFIIFIQQAYCVDRALVTDFRLQIDSVVFLCNDGLVFILLANYRQFVLWMDVRKPYSLLNIRLNIFFSRSSEL